MSHGGIVFCHDELCASYSEGLHWMDSVWMAYLVCCTNFFQSNCSAWPDVQVRPLSYTAKFPFFYRVFQEDLNKTQTQLSDCLETKAAVRGTRVREGLESPCLSATKGGKRVFLFAHIL